MIRNWRLPSVAIITDPERSRNQGRPEAEPRALEFKETAKNFVVVKELDYPVQDVCDVGRSEANVKQSGFLNIGILTVWLNTGEEVGRLPNFIFCKEFIVLFWLLLR